jgi:hypothetical protein
MPEPASSTEKPPGAGRMASSRRALPVKTSCSVILGNRLSTTSRLARPRSASSTSTLLAQPRQRRGQVGGDEGLADAALAAGDGGDAANCAGCEGCGHSRSSKSVEVCRTAGCRSSLLTSETGRRLQLQTTVAALRLGAVELLVGPLQPQRRREERTHCGAKAPPMLTVTVTCCPGPTVTGMRARRGGARARPRSRRRRGAVGQHDGKFLAADARHQVHRAHAVQQRGGHRTITWSPAAWPQVSLTRLKWSMSIGTSSSAGSPLRATRSTSRASASSKLRRLASPVSASRLDRSTRASIRSCNHPGLPGSPPGGRTARVRQQLQGLLEVQRGGAGARKRFGAWHEGGSGPVVVTRMKAV